MNPTYEAVKDRLSRMHLEDIGQYIQDWKETYKDEGGMPECVKMAIEDDLCGRAALAARWLDTLKGIDPLEHTPRSPSLGTPNQKSHTAKVRKAVGYSYP